MILKIKPNIILKKKLKLQKEYKPVKQPFVSSEKGILKSTNIKSISLKRNPNGSRILLGAGVFGSVYLGQVVFAGKKTVKKRIAIKRFNKGAKLSDQAALEYQKVIDKLRNVFLTPDKNYPNRSANARFFPKAAMVKMNINGNPEWVMVSQAFFSKKTGSKLSSSMNYADAQKLINDPKKLNAYLNEFCWVRLKLVENYGYAGDILNNLNVVNSLAIDIDCLVNGQNKLSIKEKANSLANSLTEVPSGNLAVKKKAFKKLLSFEMSKELRAEFIDAVKRKEILKKDEFVSYG